MNDYDRVAPWFEGLNQATTVPSTVSLSGIAIVVIAGITAGLVESRRVWLSDPERADSRRPG